MSLQCAVLLGIVYWGAGLKGPWLPMLLLLLLTALVGLGIGLTVSALARTSEVAIALLPLVLLPMIILAGILQPVHDMNVPMKWLAQVMPSRWAFEGLLLLEVEDRPKWTPPVLPAPPGQSTPHVAPPAGKPTAAISRAGAEQPKEQDMAERYFPREDERMGTRASGIALSAMLLLLVGAIHMILQARDVH